MTELVDHVQVLKPGGLGRVPPGIDLTIDVGPIKVEGAGSGWCRAVAFAPGSTSAI